MKNAKLKRLLRIGCGAILATTLTLGTSTPLLAKQVSVSELEQLYPQVNFQSQKPVTRADMATIIYAVSHQEAAATTIELADVPSNHWAYAAINQAISRNLMQPYRDNLFFPDIPITRAEGVSTLTQALIGIPSISDDEVKKKLADYPDAKDIPDWARKPFVVALVKDLIKLIKPNDGLRPNDFMTQGDVTYALAQQLEQQKQPFSPEMVNVQQILEKAKDNSQPVPSIIPNPPSAQFPWQLLLGLGTVGLAVVALLLGLKNRPKPPTPPEPKPTVKTTVKALIVTESELPKGESTAIIIQDKKNVPIGVAPTTVSFGPVNCTYLIRNLSGADKLFSVTATEDGNLQLISQNPALTCDNRPVSPKGLNLPGDRPFTVRYQQRQWKIEPSSKSPNQSKSLSGFFNQAWQEQEGV